VLPNVPACLVLSYILSVEILHNKNHKFHIIMIFIVLEFLFIYLYILLLLF